MQKKSVKKLVLAKETLSRLKSDELERIGGAGWNTQFDGCYISQLPSPCPSRLC